MKRNSFNILHLARCPNAILFVVLLAVLIASHALAQTGQGVAKVDLVRKLQAGGLNIYVRHAATDWSQSDKISSLDDTSSCDGAKVRQLSDKGRAQARDTGSALKALGVPFGKVFSSPYCRSVETARLMTGKEPETTVDIMNLRSADFVGGRDAVVNRARRRLSQPPGVGLNGFYSAHGNLGKAATGEYLGEGELLIIQPNGNSNFDILGRLTLSDLKKLVRH